MRRHTRVLSWGLVAIAGMAPVVLLAAESAKAVDTSFLPPFNRQLLCTVTTKVKLSTQMTASGGKVTETTDKAAELRFIDVLSKPEKDVSESQRTFLKREETVNGNNHDNPLAGLTAVFTTKDEQVTMGLSGDRVFRKKTIDDFLKTQQSLGVWLDLPSEAKVGKSYKVSVMPLAAMLLNDPDVGKAESSFTLKSFDAKSRVAVFAVTTAVHAKGKEEGVMRACDYELKGELHVAPAEKRILRINLEGTVKGTLTGGKETGSIEGTCTVELRTAVGDAASKAAKEKPKTRVNTVMPTGLGVTLSLPSYYDCGAGEPADGAYYCLRTFDKGRGKTELTLRSVPGDTNAADAFFDTFEAQLKKTYAELKTEKVSCDLGAGRAYIFTVKEKGKEAKLRAELFPCGSSFLLYRLTAPPAEFSTAEKESIAARKTLRMRADTR